MLYGEAMNAATRTFIGRVNEFVAVGCDQLWGKAAVEHFRLGLEQLETRNVEWFTEVDPGDVELTDHQWGQVLQGVRVARGFAVVDATDEDNL